jgi:hypothetical protein
MNFEANLLLHILKVLNGLTERSEMNKSYSSNASLFYKKLLPLLDDIENKPIRKRAKQRADALFLNACMGRWTYEDIKRTLNCMAKDIQEHLNNSNKE